MFKKKTIRRSRAEAGKVSEPAISLNYGDLGLLRFSDLREMKLDFMIQITETLGSSSSSSSSSSSDSSGSVSVSSSSSSSSASSWKTVGTYKTIKGIAVTFPEAPEGETGLRYFEEQPLLPHLMNYAEVKVKSSSSSSSNGKVTAASYGFAPAKKGTSAKKVLDQYLEALKRSGLEVMGGDSGYVIMSGSTVLAKIVLEKDVIQFTLIP